MSTIDQPRPRVSLRPLKKSLLILIGLSFLTALAWHWQKSRLTSEDPLAFPSLLRAAADEPSLASAAIGLCVLDSVGRVVFEHNARTAFIPASTLKTITTGTALEILGPEFRFQTQVKSSSPIAEGILNGDLVVRGGADPMLSLEDLTRWAAELKQKGLKRITGSVIGDGKFLSGSRFDDFWNWGDIGNGYGSPVSGLNLEHNRFTATLRPGAAPGAPTLFQHATPEVPAVEWTNEAITGPPGSGDQVVIHGGELTRRIFFRGTVPSDSPVFSVIGAVPDPELFAAHHFRQALVSAGIEVLGEPTTVDLLRLQTRNIPDTPVMLFEHLSIPLLDIVTSIHAKSDNHECECLYRFLGVHLQKEPDAVIRDHWRKMEISFEGLRMEDGCGLARADSIRPLDLAMVQFRLATGPQGTAFESSLLSHFNGRLHAKGGAMSGIHSYTGSATSADGKKYYFAFMVNHHADSKAAYRLRDRIVSILLGPTLVP